MEDELKQEQIKKTLDDIIQKIEQNGIDELSKFDLND